METQRSMWYLAQLLDVGDGGTYFVERRAQCSIESLSGNGQVYAPGSTAHQRHAEPFLEPPDRLTDRGVGDGKAIRGRPKTPRFRDRDEGRHSIELVRHW